MMNDLRRSAPKTTRSWAIADKPPAAPERGALFAWQGNRMFSV